MLGVSIAGIVTVGVAYLIGKKGYAPAVLLFAGVLLMVVGVLCGLGSFLPPKNSTGVVFFDLFDAVRRMFSTRLASLGLTIMAIAGFSRYMDHVKASDALFSLVAAPLRHIKNPYVLLMAAFLVTQFLSMFIPSAAGISLLLMVTIYPILIRCNISRLSALAIIGSSRCLTLGPASPNAVFGANILHMDPATYFLKYQLPVALPLLGILFVVHLLTQRYWDKKEGPDTEAQAMLAQMDLKKNESPPPLFYALLPILPLAVIIVCSPMVTAALGLPRIKLDVGTAMFLSTFFAMFVELARTRKLMPVLASMRMVFDQMGKQFTVVVALIVSGEIFARGLVTVGAIETLIKGAQTAGLGAMSMTMAASVIIFVAAILMGSGNAPFFSFAALIPDFAATMGVAGIAMMIPLDFMSAFGRTVSPVFGSTVAIAGMAGVSPFQVAKRMIVPMAAMFISCPILVFFILY